MNLQKLSKGLNFPLALTFLFALILTILVNTLDLVEINNKSMTLNDIPNNIQPVIYSILAISSVCLIFNLIVFRLLKNKLLSSIIFLILLVGLFIASIILMVNISNLNDIIPKEPIKPKSSINDNMYKMKDIDNLYNNVVDKSNYTDYTHLLYIFKNFKNNPTFPESYTFYKISQILVNSKWSIELRTPKYKRDPFLPEPMTTDDIDNLYDNILNETTNASYTDYTKLLFIYDNGLYDKSLRNYAFEKILDLIVAFKWPAGTIKTAEYVPEPIITLPIIYLLPKLNESNINVIKGISYFLGISGIISSLTNKGFTIYKLMK